MPALPWLASVMSVMPIKIQPSARSSGHAVGIVFDNQSLEILEAA